MTCMKCSELYSKDRNSEPPESRDYTCPHCNRRWFFNHVWNPVRTPGEEARCLELPYKDYSGE